MKRLLILLLPCLLMAEVGIEPVNVTGADGRLETYYRINTGNGYVNDGPIERAIVPAFEADTGVLWVDRNHRFAIGAGAAISGDGRNIFVNWYLNAQRASYYRTLGTEVPIWESPGDFTFGSNGQQLGASYDASALAISSVNDARKWSRSSPYPDWSYAYPQPAGAFTRCSRDGGRVVTVSNGQLTWLRASDGVLVWSASVPEPDRLQGLDVSDDGSIVAVTVYDSCLVYNQGARYGQVPVGTSNAGTQYAAAISGDGSRLVTGDYQGRVKLWVYDSEAYVLRWQATVGTPWVAGVAISRDGSTIACGTGYQNGKLCVFDSSSNVPLWTYQNYGNSGAYVPSVAISDDGGRIAAASWGDIATSGDFRVLTVMNRSDTTPLVAVTRDQEPGSLFAVDISADGQFVTATGKAVHAQQMGNGGEVYSVLIGATEPVNVGIQGVTTPGRHIQVGTPVTPLAVVRNYGDSTVSVPTHLCIYNSADSLLYHDSVTTAPVSPSEMVEATFASFTPAGYDLYRFQFYTALAGDAYAADDTALVPAKCYHDAAATRVRPPSGDITIGMPMQPGAVLRNWGSYSDAIGYHLTITDSVGSVAFEDSGVSGAITPEESLWARFAQWTPPTVGPYTATASVNVADDLYPANDTVRFDFRVTYEIMYDDGGAEAYYWIGRLDNDKFYVRFTPTIPPPFSVRSGRFLANMANQAFDYVMVCPGSGNKPDTLQPLQVVTNVSTPVAPGWIEFDLDITRHDQSDLWMVIHWRPGSPAIGIGADFTAPLDLRSYLSSNQDTFRLWSTADWMARLTQSPEVGIAGPGTAAPLRFGIIRAFPNPFGEVTTIEYELPAAAKVEIGIYDGTGRRVARPLAAVVESGRHRQDWTGTDNNGAQLAPGVYFAKLRDTGTGAISVLKVALVR